MANGMKKIEAAVDKTAAKMKIAPPLSEEDKMEYNQQEARKAAAAEDNNDALKKRFDKARATPRGPATRVAELKALREEVLKKKANPAANYDPKMQLQDIDHEIARLSGD